MLHYTADLAQLNDAAVAPLAGKLLLDQWMLLLLLLIDHAANLAWTG
jgi:hypothetical protein